MDSGVYGETTQRNAAVVAPSRSFPSSNNATSTRCLSGQRFGLCPVDEISFFIVYLAIRRLFYTHILSARTRLDACSNSILQLSDAIGLSCR